MQESLAESVAESVADRALERRQRLTGIGLMCAAVTCFSCLDTTAKYLSASIPVMEIVWARYVVAFLFSFAVSNPVAHPSIMRTSRPVLQVVRSALLVVSTLMAFIALRYLQLDEAVAIIFMAPFLVAALSGPMLGEWIGWQRWIAIVVAFCGVLVIARPGLGGIHPAALLTAASSVCYALYILMTRLLARTDSNETTLFYSNTVGSVVMSIAVPFVWVTPEGSFNIFLMLMLGVFGGFGHYLLIKAHRLAPAGVLGPFVYIQIVSMTLLGYLVFRDVPNHWTLAGAAIIVASGLYLLRREQVEGREPRGASPRNVA